MQDAAIYADREAIAGLMARDTIDRPWYLPVYDRVMAGKMALAKIGRAETPLWAQVAPPGVTLPILCVVMADGRGGPWPEAAGVFAWAAEMVCQTDKGEPAIYAHAAARAIELGRVVLVEVPE